MPKRVGSAAVSPPKKALKQSSLGTFISGIPESASNLYPSEKLSWKLLHSSVLHATYGPLHTSFHPGRRQTAKIAAFDFDSTLASVNGSHVFPKHGNDWKWFHSNVPHLLLHLSQLGYTIVIFTNQKNILKGEKRNINSKNAFLGRMDRTMEELDSLANKVGKPIPSIVIFAATGDDFFRKPRPGMWFLFQSLYPDVSPDLDVSFYCGDAAGRPHGWHSKDFKRDHSDADLKLAHNAGLKFFLPEHSFEHDRLDHVTSKIASAEDWIRFLDERVSTLESVPIPHYLRQPAAVEKDQHPCSQIASSLPLSSQPHVVLLVGPPASGKSTLCNDFFSHDQGFVRINQDTYGTKAKCLKAAREALASKRSIVIDNTNPDAVARKVYLELAKELSAVSVAVHLEIDPSVCLHNNAYRQHIPQAVDMLKTLNASLPNLSVAELENHEVDTSHAVIPPVAFHTFHSKFTAPSEAEGFSKVFKVPFSPRFSNRVDEYLWKWFWI